MPLGAYLPLFLMVAVAFVAVLLSHRQTARQNGFFDQLGARGQGSRRVLMAGAHEVLTNYVSGSQNTPSRFELTTAVQAPSGFTVAHEGGADRLFEGLGLEGKVATADPAFDANFHVLSDDDAFAAAYFSSERKRRAVAALFGLGCRSVELGPAGLKATWSPFSLDPSEAGFVSQALPELGALAEALPPGPAFSVHSGPTRKSFTQLTLAAMLLMLIGMVGFPVAAAAHSYRPLSGWDVFCATLRPGGAVLAVYLLAVAAYLKGRSWFLQGLLQAALAGLMVVPLYAYWGLLWANCSLDVAPAVTHRTEVAGKYYSSGRHSTTYYVRLRSWRPGRSSESLPVPRSIYTGLVPGLTLAAVDTRPGRYGFEWVSRLAFEQPAPPPPFHWPTPPR